LLLLGLALVNFSSALADVMMDAVLAEKTRLHPQLGGALQTLSFGVGGVVKIGISSLKGYLVRALGMRALFGLTLGSLLPALSVLGLGWISETPTTSPLPRGSLAEACASTGRLSSRASIFRLALLLSLLGIGLAVGAAALQAYKWLPLLLSIPASIATCVAVWIYERPVSASLAKTSLYVFLSFALQPNLIVLFKWYKATDENCDPAEEVDELRVYPLPCFSADFVGWLDVAGEIAFLGALALYHTFLSGWRYRRVISAIQVALVAVNLLDLAWVSRLNLAVGIPDWCFALGAELMQPLIDFILFIPLFSLLARLCPAEAQGTAFAINMGLLWLGRAVASYLGMGMLAMLGGVEPPEFQYLRLLVLLRSLTRALPIGLVWLLPPGDPLSHIDGEVTAEPTAATPAV